MGFRVSTLLLSAFLSMAVWAGDENSRYRVSIDFGEIEQSAVATLRDEQGSYLDFRRWDGRFGNSFQNVPPGEFRLRIELSSGASAVKSFRLNSATGGRNRQLQIAVKASDFRISQESLESSLQVSVRELGVSEKARRQFETAWTSMANSNWEKARGTLELAVAESPGFLNAWINLGVVALKQGDVSGAECAFRQAQVLRPESFEAAYNLAEILEGRGRIAEAIEQSTLAQRLRNEDPMANGQLGMLLFQAGRYRESLPYLRLTARQDPLSHCQPQLILAAIFERLGKPLDAADQLADWLQHYPRDLNREVVEAKRRQLTTRSEAARR